jgi:hypothetical protein
MLHLVAGQKYGSNPAEKNNRNWFSATKPSSAPWNYKKQSLENYDVHNKEDESRKSSFKIQKINIYLF